MTLKIYRLREVPYGFVMDDAPETVYENITEYNDTGRFVYIRTTDSKPVRLAKDAWNKRFVLE